MHFVSSAGCNVIRVTTTMVRNKPMITWRQSKVIPAMDYSMKPLMPVRYYRNTILLKKDDVFDFLMEIAYARRTNQFFDYNHYQHE